MQVGLRLLTFLDNSLQGERTPYHGEGQWPVRVDEHVEGPVDHWVQSACVMCKLTARTVRVVKLQPVIEIALLTRMPQFRLQRVRENRLNAEEERKTHPSFILIDVEQISV